MVHEDTIKLLRECNAGIKMGIDSMHEVLPKTRDAELKQILSLSKQQHEQLENETKNILNRYNDEGKEPSPIAKGMSWVKTNVMLAMEDNDKTIANLMTEGCNMGVKSLGKYLNQYKAADEQSKDIAKKLIWMEEDLTDKIRIYL